MTEEGPHPPPYALRPPLRVRPDDPGYAADAAAEDAFWSRSHAFGIGLPNAAYADGPFDRYTNLRFTGDRTTRWFETVARYGDFRRGLVLGAASLDIEASLLELNPHLHITVADLSEQAVRQHERELAERFPGRVTGWPTDLNFAELANDAYDLCVSSATLHHITNLEHLAWQINRALAPGGYAFVQDYVGEARFRFGDTKRRIFELLLERDVRERPDRASWTMDWPAESETVYSPFEAIRSDEIIPVLSVYLDPVDVRVAGALSGLFLFRRRTPAATAHGGLSALPQRIVRRLSGGRRQRSLAAFQRDVMLLDGVVCDASIVAPHNAFLVLRKRT